MSKKRSDTNPANVKPLLTCKDMANILIKTYRPSIIDSFSQDLRIACEKEALKIINNSDNYMHRKQRGRKVLAKLITNRKKPHHRVSFVGGPFNLTHHWSNKYKKEIYIWGEHHGEIVDCPNDPGLNIVNIEVFLSNIFFTNPIAFSDFYLEMQSYEVSRGYKEYEYSADRMNILRNWFGKCIGPERNSYNLCNNSRMHFFDIRQGEVRWGKNSSSLFMNECLVFLPYANIKLKEHKDKMYPKHSPSPSDESKVWDEYCYDIPFLKEITTFVKRWKSFLDFFSRFYKNDVDTKLNYNKFWYDQIYNFKLLAKEITVMHTDVKPLLNIFIKKELDKLLRFEHIKLADNSEKVIDIYENIDESIYSKQLNVKYRKIKELIDSLDNIKNRVLPFNTLITDGYLLARIFKTFKVYDKFSLYPRKTDEPAEPHNIVIYAGNAHSQRYRSFLKYLGFGLIESSGELEKPGRFSNCVDMIDIRQPFFNKWENRKDNPLDKKYFGTPDDLYYSFESVFTFYTPEKFILFDQPNVPDDLLGQVSYNDRQYVEPKRRK